MMCLRLFVLVECSLSMKGSGLGELQLDFTGCRRKVEGWVRVEAQEDGRRVTFADRLSLFVLLVEYNIRIRSRR
jgi:hypothetical protein